MQRTARRTLKKDSPLKDIRKVEVRHLNVDDYMGLRDSMVEAYKNWHGSVWSEEDIKKLLEIFPEGQVVVLVNGKVVGCALSIIVNYGNFGDDHTYQAITGNYTFSTHTRNGDVLYGIEVFVHPDYRGLRLARRLYDARKELCEKHNLKSIVFGGRIPNFALHADTITPKEY
ncbi:MAG TPA: GNAT family N-acetyltransferase, partial [Bacteroidia bacterium]|nr:GNAT family N-acetyltransferase [Bacteroidia bacterium]